MPSRLMTRYTYCRSKCYACSGRTVGVRDRRPEGGEVEPACARHADPTLWAVAVCMYCDGPNPSLDVDGDFAHKKCHAEACA